MPEPKLDREDYLKKKQGPSSTTQDLSEHLEELRHRILISVAALLLCAILSFGYSGEIIRILEKTAPAGASFFQIKPGELFMISLKISLLCGLVLSSPLIFHQIARFIEPGLKPHEKKILAIFWISPLLFIAGFIFAYYFVLPPLFAFLLNFRQGVVESLYSLEYFTNLSISILVLCALSFQMPVLLISLGFLGLLDSRLLLKPWRYIIIGAFTLSAILTPTPDPFTMSILAASILALYFTTALILKLDIFR
jgi:sec-independent protein translocase protein TatC